MEAEKYPYFTMLGQSIGSMVLGWEAVSHVVPHVMLGILFFEYKVSIIIIFTFVLQIQWDTRLRTPFLGLRDVALGVMFIIQP